MSLSLCEQTSNHHRNRTDSTRSAESNGIHVASFRSFALLVLFSSSWNDAPHKPTTFFFTSRVSHSTHSGSFVPRDALIFVLSAFSIQTTHSHQFIGGIPHTHTSIVGRYFMKCRLIVKWCSASKSHNNPQHTRRIAGSCSVEWGKCILCL